MAAAPDQHLRGLAKHAKISRFDPTKQTSFRQWMSTLKAAVSEGAAASLRYGKPTREQVRRLANIPAGDEAALNDAYALMLQNYMHYQEEVWRVLILYTDFSSNIGTSLLETIERRYGDGMHGVDAVRFMALRSTTRTRSPRRRSSRRC